MSRLRFAHAAQNDLLEIQKYIVEELENSMSAYDILKKIAKRIRILEDFPQSGSPLSTIVGFETAYRFLVCGNYLAFYKVEDDDVFIVRILYNRRDYLKILFNGLPENNE